MPPGALAERRPRGLAHEIVGDPPANPQMPAGEYIDFERVTLQVENENRKIRSHMYHSARRLIDLLVRSFLARHSRKTP
jgi:hypothetical protein